MDGRSSRDHNKSGKSRMYKKPYLLLLSKTNSLNVYCVLTLLIVHTNKPFYSKVEIGFSRLYYTGFDLLFQLFLVTFIQLEFESYVVLTLF